MLPWYKTETIPAELIANFLFAYYYFLCVFVLASCSQTPRTSCSHTANRFPDVSQAADSCEPGKPGNCILLSVYYIVHSACIHFTIKPRITWILFCLIPVKSCVFYMAAVIDVDVARKKFWEDFPGHTAPHDQIDHEICDQGTNFWRLIGIVPITTRSWAKHFTIRVVKHVSEIT
jgi:hypothetical protein